MDFKAVKLKFEEFAIDEAEAFRVDNNPDLEQQNKAYDKMHRHVVAEMNADLGVVRLTNLKSPLVYRLRKNVDFLFTPRLVLKIAHYKHNILKDVWVVYCSGQNEMADSCSLGYAYFMAEIEGQLKIAREYLYSNYERDNFDWVGRSGWQDLSFESLGELVGIERYIEPLVEDWKVLYFQEK